MAQMDGQRAQQYYDPSISVVIPTRSLEGPAPLSFEQEQLWFLAQLIPDVSALERSLNGIARRHAVLCTTFTMMEGQPVQVIAPTLTVSLPAVDVRDFPEADYTMNPMTHWEKTEL